MFTRATGNIGDTCGYIGDTYGCIGDNHGYIGDTYGCIGDNHGQRQIAIKLL